MIVTRVRVPTWNGLVEPANTEANHRGTETQSGKPQPKDADKDRI
jgi:hypothetical protein